MVHLRIVVPTERAERTLTLLEGSPAITNVVHLARAARKPAGDLVLCDVAREQVSLLIADLRELDLDTEGSIAIEEIDGEISAAAEEAERSAEPDADPVVWEEVTARTSDSIVLTPTFVLFMTLATLIASVGIYFDEPILIVGAMVVGPEFGPIAGACVALVNGRGRLLARSGLALAVGFPIAIAAAYLATLALRGLGEAPESIDFSAHLLTRFIAEPDIFSVYVALLAGVVGALSLTAAKSSALVGVLISVATIPAAANMGVAAAYENWSVFGGATRQLAINLAAIFVGALLTLWIQRLAYVRRRRRHLRNRSRADAGLPVGSSRRASVDPDHEPEAF